MPSPITKKTGDTGKRGLAGGNIPAPSAPPFPPGYSGGSAGPKAPS